MITNIEIDVLLERYSRTEIPAAELRRRLGNVSYADVMIELAKRNLRLLRASQKGA